MNQPDTAKLTEATFSLNIKSIFGYAYHCQSCLDFDACKKCYGRIDLYHNHLRLGDGKPHLFEFRKAHDKEFEEFPAPRSPTSLTGSIGGTEGNSRRGSTGLDKWKGELFNDDELYKVADGADELGLEDLDDLDELEVLEEDAASS